MRKGFFKLSEETIDIEKKYFLDANVWIFALGNPPGPNTNGVQYIKFLDSLIENESPIYCHTILISEVFNALMRIAFSDYLKMEELKTGTKPKLDFKKDFRGMEEYSNTFKRFQSDFQAYLPYFKIIDKEYEYELGYLIKNLPVSSDFNDYLYYEMALDQGLSIVTDDGDFNYSGIEIITENRSLLGLSL
ncbi:PIN domain-containing protein [Aquiflexum lacus]|uniref:PIN domain-containing protein n=1 Tax=Aquiflexum lacus TaxID=2483805 RepID=UPI0018954B10|nr:PIN domain-containing protein [Aquiflexum lacus]